MARPGHWGTYGEVVDEAERAVVRSAAGSGGPFTSDEDALAAAGAFSRLRRVLARHVRLLVGPARPTELHGVAWVREEFAATLQAGTETPRRDPAGSQPTARAWTEAADLLGVAHDMLASHLDADRRPLTAEGELLLDPDVVWPAATRMAAVTLALEIERGVVARQAPRSNVPPTCSGSLAGP